MMEKMPQVDPSRFPYRALIRAIEAIIAYHELPKIPTGIQILAGLKPL